MDINGWKFHTYVKPNKNYDLLENALNIFLSNLLLSKDKLKEIEYNSIKLYINTDQEHNNIYINNNIYYKDKFLLNHKLKQRLIDYYNELGIFVKGPIEILKRDGTPNNKWLIELSKMYYK